MSGEPEQTLERELIEQCTRKERPHVTFAPLPPPSFLHKPRRKAVDLEHAMDEVGFTTLKQGFSQLRTPYGQGNWTFGQICAIIVGLIIMFLFIWWITWKFLLVEIEEQVRRPTKGPFTG
jgi:hypothetical protein